MIWLIVVLGGLAIVYFAARKRPPSSDANLDSGAYRQQLAPGVTFTSEVVRPDPAEWEREREERRRARETALAQLRAAFVRPASLAEAVAGLRGALAALAQAQSLSAPDTEAILGEARQAGVPAKIELVVRKRLNAAYKLRADPAKLLEALACCLVQVQLLLEYKDPAWKVASSLKRIANNLDYEHHRRAAIGFLLVAGDSLRQDRPDVAASCEEEVARLFSHWHADEEARARFQTDLARIERTSSASDKHFLINGLVEYLDRRRRFDPSVRAQLVGLCEQDVALSKQFLGEFHRDGQGRASFSRAVQSEHYMCPRLPSFDILWDLFEEERDVRQLRRLQKIAREIKYGDFEIDEELESPPPRAAGGRSEREPVVGSAPPPAATASVAPDLPTEIVEACKSGQSGKVAFLTAAGEPCSTEGAAEDHFRRLGWKTLRAEVRFWQAMFGLAFWEEIFAGSGAPNALNDIPLDHFSGAAFYEARRASIDAKAAVIARSDVRQFISQQLRRFGGTWTRIVYDGPREFSYRRVLESPEVSDFLSTIPPAVFAAIVHRIATNPNDHRAGLPDFVMWKDGIVVFIEVKGIREKIRDSQAGWIAWLMAQGIPTKVVRVKGVAAAAPASAGTGSVP